MSRPRRLLDDGATTFERDLLEAWKTQRGPSCAREHALGLAVGSALALGTPTATAASASKVVGAASSGTGAAGAGSIVTTGLAKWILLTATVAVVGGGAAIALSRGEPAPSTNGPATPPSMHTASTGEGPAQGAFQPEEPAPAENVTASDAPRSPLRSPRRGEPEAKPRMLEASIRTTTHGPTSAAPEAVIDAGPNHVAATAPINEGLAPSLALLQSAREDLVDERSEAALRKIDLFDAQYPGSPLGEEAAILRFDALVRKGDLRRAKAIARDILANRPRTPYANRLRCAIESPP